MGDRAAGGHEPLRHRLVVDLAEEAPALDEGAPRLRVDAHAAQARQVELQALLAGGLAGRAVAAALDRDQELALVREGDGIPDVRNARRLNDQRRVLVDHAVVEFSGLIIAGIVSPNHRAAEACFKLGCRVFEHGVLPKANCGVPIVLDLSEAQKGPI